MSPSAPPLSVSSPRCRRGVAPVVAEEGVAAVAAVEAVAAGSALDRVGAGLAKLRVGARVAAERVVPVVAEQLVAPVVAGEGVGAVVAGDDGHAGAPRVIRERRVGRRARRGGRCRDRRGQHAGRGETVDLVVTAAAAQRVAAATAADHVRSGGRAHRAVGVVARRPDERAREPRLDRDGERPRAARRGARWKIADRTGHARTAAEIAACCSPPAR